MVKPTLIVFDLGGVLVRICRSWSEGCCAAGLPVRGDSASMTASGARHVLSQQHGTGAITPDEFCLAVSRGMQGLYTPEEVRRIHDAWIIDEYPGVERLVHDIHAAGLDTAILSNTNAAHWDRLPEFRAPSLVRRPHASHLLRLLKPNCEIYHEFARREGYAGRERELLFFDDLEENVAAARDCGWQAEQIDHAGDTAEQMRRELLRRGVL